MKNSGVGWMFTSGILIGLGGTLAYLLRDEKNRQQVSEGLQDAKHAVTKRITDFQQNIEGQLEETTEDLEDAKKHLEVPQRTVH